MNAWEVLGIEPTSDKKEIKKAYARLLKQYHPEENPEEFKQIQAAYQQCLHQDQEIESASFEQNKQDIKTQPIQLKKIQSFLHLFLSEKHYLFKMKRM